MLIITFCTNCNNNTDIYYKKWDKIIDVQNRIISIKTDINFGNSLLYIVDDLLIVNEVKPEGQKSIHIFDKNSFNYITSAGIIGRGPGEISVTGRIGVDQKNKVLWVPDHGNKVLWKFPIDSVLKNSEFRPSVRLDLDYELFIERFSALNDSIILGKAVQILPNSSFEMHMARLNINNNQIEKFGYEHPSAKGKESNSQFALSLVNKLYVNCYGYYDLVTICDLNGNLKYNIFGPDQLNNKGYKKSYYSGVDVMENKIVAAYIGDSGIIYDGNISRGNIPSKFQIFDFNGNYVQTIETGFKFTFFCVDEENKRIICFFDDKPEALGYFDFT